MWKQILTIYGVVKLIGLDKKLKGRKKIYFFLGINTLGEDYVFLLLFI